jgi:hypothetical protein
MNDDDDDDDDDDDAISSLTFCRPLPCLKPSVSKATASTGRATPLLPPKSCALRVFGAGAASLSAAAVIAAKKAGVDDVRTGEEDEP